jgi:DNA-directed RNA polymerase specialized sigma24 family protein
MNKARSDQTLAAVRRAEAAAQRAKRAEEASRVTRDAAIAAAMEDGWTSAEIGALLGIPDHAVRHRVYSRRTGKPGKRRAPERPAGA